VEYRLASLSKVAILSLSPGEFVLESVEKFIKYEKIENGLIMTGFGTLSQVHLHWVTTTGFPPVEHFEKCEGPYELLSLSGVIAKGQPHIHAVVSDTEKAYGGHLETGNKVLYLCEIVVGVIEGVHMERKPMPEGIKLLKFS